MKRRGFIASILAATPAASMAKALQEQEWQADQCKPYQFRTLQAPKGIQLEHRRWQGFYDRHPMEGYYAINKAKRYECGCMWAATATPSPGALERSLRKLIKRAQDAK